VVRELSLAEERERGRLAGELHDSPMQKLALAQMQFSAASRELDSGRAARLGNGLDLMREALDELRTLQFELSPPMLHREGIAPALQWLVSRASERSDVAFSFQGTATLAAGIPQDLAIVLFQSARELVHNVAKHASATSAKVELDVHDEEVVLTVTDDGKGFDASGTPRRGGGFGLFSLRERIALRGGEVSIESSEHGSRVSVRLPLQGSRTSAAGSSEQSLDTQALGSREALP
jgi:signal transduction histidine kinase